MIKILFVFHGNICRSPMCQSIFTHMVKEQNLTNHFKIDSAATSREEIGNPPHYGTAGKLRQVGIPLIPHRAEQMTKADYDAYDIIHFLRREMLDFTAFPVFFVSNLLLVQRKKYYFNRATVSRNCSIVL